MGKPKNERREADNEARAFAKFIDSSPYKLNLVAEMIRGKKAEKALVDLDFSMKRTAREVKKVLQSAIANAENNHNLDVDRLYVSSATVGKQMVLKRFMARGRGKAGSIQKFFSNLTIVVSEKAE
jgi:large subunit ribosomal protein L22